MNKRQRKTFELIFKRPTPSNVKWADIESLLRSLDAEIGQGAGSRVHVVLNGVRVVLHRPHPGPEVDKGALVSIRRFFETTGVKL